MAQQLNGTGGQVLNSGSSVATSPAQFDNSTSIATMEAVQRALGNFSKLRAPVGASAYQCASLDVGSIIHLTLSYTATSIILPQATASLPQGSIITINNFTGHDVTVTPFSGDTLYRLDTSSGNILIKGGGVLKIYVHSVGNWVAFGGDASLSNSPAFGILKASNGYQKLPSGLVMQWGVSTFTNAGSLITFPVAFTSCFGVYLGNAEGVGTIFSATSVTLTNFIGSRSVVSGSANTFWFALGLG